MNLNPTILNEAQTKKAKSILGGLAIAAVAFSCHQLTKLPPEEQARCDAAAGAERKCEDEVTAYTMAKRFDATNGFAATIRTPFAISVKRVSGDKWHGTGIAFGGT